MDENKSNNLFLEYLRIFLLDKPYQCFDIFYFFFYVEQSFETLMRYWCKVIYVINQPNLIFDITL